MSMTPGSLSQTVQQIHTPTHEGSPPNTKQSTSKVVVLWKLGPQYSKEEVQLYEGDFLELEAKGQGTEFPDVTPPPTKRESDVKKELEAYRKT